MAAEKLMTVAKFGERLGIKKDAAYGVIRRYKVKTVNVGSVRRPRLRVSEAEYARYIKTREDESRRVA